MRPRLVVTQGDPLGIGPEVLVRALANDAAGGADVTVLGDQELIADTAVTLGLPVPARIEPAPESGPPSALWALEEACRRANDGRADGIVTAPVTKHDLVRQGFEFPGQTEFLGARLNAPQPTMMLAGDELRVALVTTHMPLRDVPAAVTDDAIVRAVRHTHRGLCDWFGIEAPRIAVLGLNPHAGEDGVLGHEDAETIAPAIARCRAEGIDCEGPLAGDGAFAPRTRRRFDAHVAMFHDQGLAALKALCGGSAVNLTLGLPVPRTSPDHGSARDIAGRGLADAGSMEAALRLAVSACGRLRGKPFAAAHADSD